MNDALRLGLSRQTTAKRSRFQVKAHDLRLGSGIDPNGFNQLLDELEADDCARKMAGKNHP